MDTGNRERLESVQFDIERADRNLTLLSLSARKPGQLSDPICWRDGFLSGLQSIIGDNFDGPFDFVILDAHLPLGDTPLLLPKLSDSLI